RIGHRRPPVPLLVPPGITPTKEETMQTNPANTPVFMAPVFMVRADQLAPGDVVAATARTDTRIVERITARFGVWAPQVNVRFVDGSYLVFPANERVPLTVRHGRLASETHWHTS